MINLNFELYVYNRRVQNRNHPKFKSFRGKRVWKICRSSIL